MPRSIQDILDHADELADRFEEFDPDAAQERRIEEYMLERAVLRRAASEDDLIDAVMSARSVGITRRRIGSIIGTSAQAVQQRYGPIVLERSGAAGSGVPSGSGPSVVLDEPGGSDRS